MTTGLEIAGLILGLLPVIFAALEQYSKGFDLVNAARSYVSQLEELQQDIKVQFNLYQNTLESLLSNIVPARTLRLLLLEPEGPLWEDKNVVQRRQLFLQQSYKPFCHTVTGFHKVVAELQSRFQCKQSNQVSL